ncbi:cell division protein FtsA [Desulfofalx alkaliphila]|uniref:cell division protein FtsA n=1 Tax=Desulfofalx alkaliphila TaxID=105483 RepID=UPI0004E14268|nr:cell division FtsA domain-containing protein [Desulfofalx alkaliphila]
MDNKIFALDIGTRSVIGVAVVPEDDKLKILAQYCLEHDSRAMYDGQIHDIPKVAKGVAKVKEELEKKLGCKLERVAIAAAGRSLKTRIARVEMSVEEHAEIDSVLVQSLEMSGLQKAQQELAAENKEDTYYYCVGHTVLSYYLNGYAIANLLGHSGKTIGAEILATFLPDSVVNSLYSVLHKVGLEPTGLTLEPIAAIDLAIPEDVRTLNLALVDIGAGTADIAITNDGTISAYGMVPVAGDEITEAIIENFLVDFKTAENIKRQLKKKKKITYTDILGIKNTVAGGDIIQALEPALDHLTKSIAEEIIRLNGGKPPKTVFCIGGGAQSPQLSDKLAQLLNLPKMRVAVRGRDMLSKVLKVEKDPIGGPEGVTVLGIANMALKKVSRDFITVKVNGQDFSLFNFKDMTVANVLGLVDFNPRDLIASNGKNLTFTLNGQKKQIYGALGTPARITVNNKAANIQTLVKDGDRIQIIKAKPGANAKLTLGELISSQNLPKGSYKITVNGKPESEDYQVQNDDAVEIIEEQESSRPNTRQERGITVTVNGEQVKLVGVEKPVFVDIFNFIDFDVRRISGPVKITVNGKAAEYTQPLMEGDVIQID